MTPKSLSAGKILFTTLTLLAAPQVAPAVTLEFLDVDSASVSTALFHQSITTGATAYATTPTAGNYATLLQRIQTAATGEFYPLNTFYADAVSDGAGGDTARIAIVRGYAGAVHLASDTTFTFKNNTSSSSGAAFALSATAQAFFSADAGSHYIFTGNVANGNDGGAINIVTSSVLSLANATFTENRATGTGGAIYENSGTLLLSDASFFGNEANRGGAIFSNRIAHLDNVIFKGNTAALSGGAIYSNRATGSGILWIANATFDGNSSGTGEGGAIYNQDQVMTLANVSFTGNSGFYGGAIINKSAVSTLTDVVFLGNTSGNPDAAPSTRSSNPSRGGAIYNQSGGTLTLTNATFALNFADRGTAIHNISTGSITGTNLLFAGGVDLYKAPATTVNSGGAIYNDASTGTGTTAISLTNATFTGNASFESGGAIYNDGTGSGVASVTLSNSVFIKNFARATGGAIFNKDDSITLTDAVFARNHADINGGAIYSAAGAIELKTSAGATTTFAGNTSGPLGSSTRNSLTLSADGEASASLLISFPTAAGVPSGILDMRDPISSASGDSGLILQQNNGTWKLGGKSVLGAAGGTNSTSIHIQGGTLYLYRGDELDNASGFDGIGIIENRRGSFSLYNGATLAAGGGNEIIAPSITLSNGSKLAFDLAHATVGNPVLTLTRENSLGNGTFSVGTSIQIDLLSLNANSGNYTLLSSTDGTQNRDNFGGTALNGAVTVRGESITGTRVSGLTLTGTAHGITLQQNSNLVSAVSTWNDASGGNWNISDAKWTGAVGGQFLHGDVANFANDNASTVAIALNPTGNRTVLAAGIHFSGPANYTFSGTSIETDGTAGTSLNGDAVHGKLVLGANAALASGSTTTLDTTSAAATYTGTVDISGTVANTFHGGIDLYSGTLRIGAAAQIDTRLSNLSFLGTAGNTANVPTLSIKQGTTVTFFDAGTHNQHLAIASGKSGAIYTESGATLVIEREAQTDSGVFSVGAGGKLELGGTGRFIFRGDSDAIYNNGGTVTLKVASGATSLFTGNYSGVVAHSVVLSSGAALEVITDGTDGVLEMHDPFKVKEGNWTVTKTGAGTWKLGGSSTVDGTGTFAVGEGTLHLFSANEGIAVVDAGTLDLGNNGTFELGTSGGTGPGATLVLQTGTSITAANVIFHNNATTILKIDATGDTDPGSLITATTVTIGGNLVLDLDVGYVVGTWTEFELFDGAISGQFSSVTDVFGRYQWAFDPDTGKVSFTGIPEPSTYALFGAIGAIGLALLRRRRKSKIRVNF